jgi:hypothetical protein
MLDLLRKYVLRPLASLRLTVILFALAIGLVLFGTLAQVDAGNWTVIKHYFRNYGFVWVPFQIFFPRTMHVAGGFPYPGGWLLGILLMVNLLAAHSIRFQFTWKDAILLPAFALGYVLLWIWQEKPPDSPLASLTFLGGSACMVLSMALLVALHGKRGGIILIHLGLIVMMVSEWITGVSAVEGRMSIETGKSSNQVIYPRDSELAIVDRSRPDLDDVVVVPSRFLRAGEVIRNELLPFEVETIRYLENSTLVKPVPDQRNPATQGAGLHRMAVEQPETAGTDSEQRVEMPSAYVTLRQKGTGQVLGTFLVSAALNPQWIQANDKPYEIALRFKETYRPFRLHLLEFIHENYEGSETPKNFTSKVQLRDPERGEDRQVVISMNEPLRYRGETFYQADWLRDGQRDLGTILQVVSNPGWLMPYISCVMVGLGLLLHFSMHLVQFLIKFVRAGRATL